MKILILANNNAGLYIFRKMLVEALLNKGNEIVISCPDGEFRQTFSDMGCKYISTYIDRRGINPKTDFALIRTYFSIVKQERPDLVITYTIKPNIYGGLVCRRKKISYAVNITGLGHAFQQKGFLRTLVIHLYKASLKKASVIFFENSADKKTLENLKICRKDQTKLLNGAGVDLEHYSYAEYPRAESPTHFLFIGRVMKEKGVDELLTAMKQLLNDGEDCVLDVVGEYEEDYSSMIKEYQKDGWLNYYGYQRDVRPFIQKAHCFVLPSWNEGMANTNLECAASGRPVITSDIPGCREAVIDGVTGRLCERRNADSLYSVMKRFLKLNQEQREIMGKEGRKHMEMVFDKRKVVENTLEGLGL